MIVRCRVLALVVALLTGPAPVGAPPALAPAPSLLSAAEVAALDPDAQAVLLAPLRAAAAALDAVGRSQDRDVYAGVALDASTGRTDLYLTDPGAAAGVLAAARLHDPDLAANQVVVHRAAYALTVLDAASRQAVESPEPYALYASYPAPDASGVRVEVRDPVAASRESAPDLEVASRDGTRVRVPVTFVAGSPRVAHDWDAVKWHDSAPFIGGDVLTSDGDHHYCTAGLPAVRKKDRHPVMVTANHCFGSGDRVYTAAGRTWAYRNGRTGRYVGTVTRRSTAYDAEVLDGADDAADESDTSGWKPLTSVAYSYRGDDVCHSGARSAADGHPTPCGIEVTIDDLYFREGGHTVRGVEGEDVHGWGSVNGDSGGTVFAVQPHGTRQLRGQVSSGGADGTDDQRRVDWPEAVDIFRTLGLELDPET
ncbi:chymotrypsin family serine protease [Microlunatus antarcticus]|uniref:Trypsin n=1 Tax=Microlunatus antarcticus TaxID=53388 RepID=A0A7W5JWP3_9ACTN|nr:peptidase [Microlunatus antarcticus]MBB3327702.1 hypothetical protein [Microlunatus antarcticus]